MGSETVLFKSEEKKSANEIAQVLRQVAEMKVEEEQGRKLKKSFEIELEWFPGEAQEGGAKIL